MESGWPQKLLVLVAPGAEMERDAIAPCNAATPAIFVFPPPLPPTLCSNRRDAAEDNERLVYSRTG